MAGRKQWSMSIFCAGTHFVYNKYINDLDENILSKIWKFADETKSSGSASLEKGSCSIETDLKKFTKYLKI